MYSTVGTLLMYHKSQAVNAGQNAATEGGAVIEALKVGERLGFTNDKKLLVARPLVPDAARVIKFIGG